MAKTREVPKDLRAFNEIFERLCYRHDYAKVFDDFLTICVGYFSNGDYDAERADVWKQYNDKEKITFQELFNCMVITYHDVIYKQEQKWFDLFGTYYEILVSRGKSSRLGQFFTPSAVVDLLTQMQNAEGVTGHRVNDCACGSGRNLIAFWSHYPGNFVYGQDIDIVCVKMSCLNLMFHGAEGEVVWGDALQPSDYRAGWSINSDIRITGLPTIKKLPKENSFIYSMWDHNAKAKEENKNSSQLTLF